MQEWICEDLESLNFIASEILENIVHPLVLMQGNLGAGKTTLVKAILKKINVEDSGSSPTFAIANEYLLPNRKIFHLDLYRINHLEEALDMGLETYLEDQNNLVFIEWPEVAEAFLIHEPHHLIEILVEDDKRIIKFA